MMSSSTTMGTTGSSVKENLKPAFVKVRPATPSDYKTPIKEFQNFYDAIVSDDAAAVRAILKAQADPLRLMDSEFNFQYAITDKSRKVQRISLPLHLAVGAMSTKVAELFLQSGVDIERRDCRDRNVLHILITTVVYVRGQGEDAVCTMIPWLVEKLGIEVMHRFSRQENQDGLRPVEYAAQQNTLKLMKALLETVGLHTSGSITKGDTCFQDLDVTEYETLERHSKSPFNMLAYLDKDKLNDPDTAQVLLSPVFRGWWAAKMRTDVIPLALWTLYRMTGMIVYFIADANVKVIAEFHGANASQFICEDLSHISFGMTGTFLVCVLFVLVVIVYCVLEMILLIRDRKLGLFKQKYNIRGRKALLSNALFYTVMECSFIALLATLTILFFVTAAHGPNDTITTIFDMIRLVMPLIFVWLAMYPLQTMPYLGPFLVSVQGMIADMVKFMLLFLIFLLPFIHGLETYVLANSQQGCIEDFSSPLHTGYTLFKMMLNMVDLGQYDIQNIGALYVMHVLFVFMVAILLLNFLVAVMASSTSQIADNEKVILMVNRLAVLVELERSSFWARSWLYRWLNKIGFSVCDAKVILRYEKCRLREIFQVDDL